MTKQRKANFLGFWVSLAIGLGGLYFERPVLLLVLVLWFLAYTQRQISGEL